MTIYEKTGQYIIKTSATNAVKTGTGASVPVNVTANRPPAFETEPPTEAGVDRPWYYAAKAVDPDGDKVSYALVSGPGRMTIAPESGLLSWTPGADYIGQHTVIIAAYDDFGGSTRQEFTLTVQANLQNRPPEITSTPTTTVASNTTYSYQVIARDPDGDLLYYSLDEAPAGMKISPNGLITWEPSQTWSGKQFR